MKSLSGLQFKVADSLGVDTDGPTPSSPSSLATQSFSSAAKATAWTTRSLAHGGTPLPLSKRTRGSYVSWDDDGGNPSMPQSDPGSNYALGR